MADSSDTTCWTLIRAAAAGDTSARSLFARSYAWPVRTYLRSRWSAHRLQADVDDAVQDVFVECFKSDGVLSGVDSDAGGFRALLYAVVRNVARRYEERAAKSADRRPDERVHLDELPHQEESLSRCFDREWAQALLRLAAERHEQHAKNGDDEQRRRLRVLQMRHAQGLPVREIAAALQADVDRIHLDYRLARRDFASHLREVTRVQTGLPKEEVDAECRRLGALLAR